MKTIFETGATSHAINDLVLFTDNTKELADIRDEIYLDIINAGWFGTGKKFERFNPLLISAIRRYIAEFPEWIDHRHITLGNLTIDQQNEFCQLYVNYFEIWKKENSNY